MATPCIILPTINLTISSTTCDVLRLFERVNNDDERAALAVAIEAKGRLVLGDDFRLTFHREVAGRHIRERLTYRRGTGRRTRGISRDLSSLSWSARL